MQFYFKVVTEQKNKQKISLQTDIGGLWYSTSGTELECTSRNVAVGFRKNIELARAKTQKRLQFDRYKY